MRGFLAHGGWVRFVGDECGILVNRFETECGEIDETIFVSVDEDGFLKIAHPEEVNNQIYLGHVDAFIAYLRQLQEGLKRTLEEEKNRKKK